MGANIPGKPRLFLPYIGGVGNYRDHCAAVAASGYEGFAVSGEGKDGDGTRPGDDRAA
jgi:cyclohexanone monooxygenase